MKFDDQRNVYLKRVAEQVGTGNADILSALCACYDNGRNVAMEEAVRHVKLMETSLGSTDYNEGWNGALELIMGDLKALARPVQTAK